MIAVISQANDDKIKPVTLPSGVVIGTPIISTDGRCAMCHSFTEEDIAYLTASGATMYETLPSDFVIPQEGI